jgi:hypothetical protein
VDPQKEAAQMGAPEINSYSSINVGIVVFMQIAGILVMTTPQVANNALIADMFVIMKVHTEGIA